MLIYQTPLVRKDYIPFYPQQYQLCAAVKGPFAIYNRWNVFCHEIHPLRRHSQEFDYFVVIDFEATCDRGKPPSPQEIIEFPSVIVSSSTGKIVASFQTYVRPTCNRFLIDFCKDLTGRQQAQVDQGVTLSAARKDWSQKYQLCYRDLDRLGLPGHIGIRIWINLKVPFGEMFGRERCNLKQAVERAGPTVVWMMSRTQPDWLRL